jgi:hypothetical protein
MERHSGALKQLTADRRRKGGRYFSANGSVDRQKASSPATVGFCFASRAPRPAREPVVVFVLASALASAFRLQPELDQAANCFGTRGMVILGLCPEVQFSEWGRLQSNSDRRALAGGGRAAPFSWCHGLTCH